MEVLHFEILLRLLVAHFLSDFILQSSTMAEKKDKEGKYFWLHIAITSITLIVLLWDWHLWPVFVFVIVSHLIIDAIKSRLKDKGIFKGKEIYIFLADQFLHLLIIFIVWLVYSQQFCLFIKTIAETVDHKKFWFLSLSFLLLSMPSSVLIGKMTNKWSKELGDDVKGLEGAGKWIGIIERLLIFVFILINQIVAIGFLLTAKSVFRFGDLKKSKHHKKTEYIIIGTFLSFSIALAIGLIYKIMTH
jgi:hypothetical protein